MSNDLNSETVTPSELQKIMESGNVPLIDVLPQAAYDEKHIPGAMNACEYEMVFLEKVNGLIPAKETAFVLYGESDKTLEAQEAATKLQEAGFKSVRRLLGGIEAWIGEGHPAEFGPPKTPVAQSGTLVLDLEQSGVRWSGSNLFSNHTGTLPFKEGRLEAQEGTLLNGKLVIDMEKIRCTDLLDAALNALLVRHLSSADFFDVAHFPTATFIIDSLQPIPNAVFCQPNYRLNGRLELRGVERPLTFTALIAGKADGTHVGQARLAIVRTEWGVLYGSGNFFARLEEHLVDDLIHLHLKVVAVPEKTGS